MGRYGHDAGRVDGPFLMLDACFFTQRERKWKEQRRATGFARPLFAAPDACINQSI